MELLILALATWRLSSLLVNENGPADILAQFRDRVGVRYDERSQPYGSNTTGVLRIIAGVLACLWCCSVWVGVAWATLFYAAPEITFWLALPLALSAGAIVVERMTK